jgi:peptidyl-dipeptidase Dcp
MKSRLYFILAILTLSLALGGCAHNHEAKTMDSKSDSIADGNPFFSPYQTPFDVPPFDRIKNEHYLPAIDEGIKRHQKEIEAIVKNTANPTFDNTLGALDRSGRLLKNVSLVYSSQLSAHTDDQLNELAKQISPKLTKHNDDILLNNDLFVRVKELHQKKAELNLNAEQTTLLDKLYKDFVRGGANLGSEEQKKLREINEKLGLLYLEFRQNILKENNRFELVLDNKDDLAGLPQRVISAAAQAAQERKHPGKWAFTLHKPSLIPFLQYSDKRELREKMFKGYINRGANQDELDNKENIKKIVSLRGQKAKLLGYKTWADFILEDRMAKQPDKVYDLLNKIWQAALPVADQEAKQLQEMIKKEGQDFKLEAWDWWYYAEKLRKQKYDLDENELRPYFKLENVLQGAFEVAQKLFGIKFEERKDLPKYHPDVRTFEVKEKDGRHIGIFYVDYFPRKSKRGGAWCGAYRGQYREEGKRIAPIITNVGNFSMPTDDKPSLLSYEEVTTLFHEFGHALHFLLSDIDYETSGDIVKVDFVELPSQIMENWAGEPQVLKMYARHYETDQPIPDSLIEKITKSKYFNQGFATVEYLAASFLDMDWHSLSEPQATSLEVDKIEEQAMQKIGLIPEIVVRYKSPYFQHIFGSDFYSAGYYSYIWAAVLDADAFEFFKQKGLFDQTTAEAFRTDILSKVGSEDPMTLYKRFRGSEPEIAPLLKRRGLLTDKTK